ncbi:MAG: hypothetical protein EA406_00685 [Rhodospirillales bacterium]|nr:MAG: hypothetical protein EA406_00685 [Rhodospirillales bacterium]
MTRAVTLTLGLGVALGCGLPAAAADDLVVQALSCRGNEPFWALDISATSAFERSLLADGSFERTYQGRLSSFAFLDPPWAVFRGETEDAETVVLVAREEACFDTMKGEAFDQRAVVSFPDGTAATGCCHATLGLDVVNAPEAVPETKPAGDWSRLLPHFAAGIERCVAAMAEPVAAVTTAWPMNRGLIGVRLQDAGGTRTDCIVGQTGDRIDRLDVVAEGDRLRGEDGPALLLAADGPPLLTCGRVERVVTEQGGTWGYLHYGGPCPAAN